MVFVALGLLDLAEAELGKRGSRVGDVLEHLHRQRLSKLTSPAAMG